MDIRDESGGSMLTPSELQAAFDRIVFETLRPGLLALSLLYVFFGGAHLGFLTEPARTVMATIAFLSAPMLFLGWVVLGKVSIPVRWAHPIATAIAGVVLFNSAIHQYITNAPRDTTNLIILSIGCGCIFLSSTWLTVVLTATFAGWLAATCALVGSAWLSNLDYGLISGIVLAAIIHTGRIRIYTRLEELRHRDERRNTELEAALQSAEHEIAERKRIESDLKTVREELEVRVLERTVELAKANTALRGEIEERVRAEKEQEHLEAQLRHSQKMDAIGQLAAGVAHDFNNILTIIQGHASLLLELCRDNPEQADMLKQITQAADRAALLTSQLLLFSKKRVMQTGRVNLNEVIKDWAKVLGRFLGESITLEFHLAPNLPMVDGDPTMIEQVLMNLTVNARDAMPRGGILTVGTSAIVFDEANLQTRPEGRIGCFVRMRVADTGVGIDPAILPRIFEPFFTTKPLGKGTGLGLSTVYGIVQQHHGWIEVNSGLSQGTEFQVFLPTATEATRTIPQESTSQTIRGGTERIMVVEDEAAVRQLVCRLLQRHGYRIFEAASGVEALSLWERERGDVDLLLTDLVMPGGLTGRELAERCLAQRPELRVIYTSGYSTDFADLETTLGSRIHFLAKPYQFSTLARLVRECLDESR